MSWEVVIGLETHAQLSTQSKIFSGASTAFGASPNSQASAVDIALPGVLPVLNRGAVERAIRFGLAVNGRISRRSVSEHTIATGEPHPLVAPFSLERFHSGYLIDEHGASGVAH